MPIRGICRLCSREDDLLKSHYVPQALYPKKWQKSRTITHDVIYAGQTAHIKDHLLCAACEGRFADGGEDEVLRWLAPKAKQFTLADRLNVALARESYPDISRFAAYSVGVDAAKFAYFAMSIAWRGAVHQWTLPDGTDATKLNLGQHEERLRRFLLGETEFPHDIASVIVVVCSDKAGRSVWGLPTQNFEAGCGNIRFIMRGVVFRLLLEPTIPEFFREKSCVSPRECIFYGDSAHRVKKDFAPLFEGFDP
jgi:hypothetical protein